LTPPPPATPPPATSSTLCSRVFAAVLFDLDGTLVDSTAAVERCWRRWAAEFGVRLPAVLEHGMPARTGVSRYLPAHLVEAGVARMEQLEVSDTEGITALPGASEALATVGTERAAVVTSCTAELAQARVSAAGIAAPNVVITVDQIARGKPDPEGFLLAAHRLGVEPGLCLVVEDAPSGLVAARAAGCATIALTTTTPRSALVADLIVNSLANVRFAVVRDGVRVAMAR
jgi:sugar-phosphatase